MESYVPLVKAVIISTIYFWGTTSVTITDHYILKDMIIKNDFGGGEKQYYQVYDLKTNMIHFIFPPLESQMVFPDDSIDWYIVKFRAEKGIPYTPGKISVSLKRYDDYKCKMEKREMQILSNTRYIDHSYFAMLPWLDTVLNSREKMKFAGFMQQDYTPYNYLVCQVRDYENGPSEKWLIRKIDRSNVDTTLIRTLLGLPQVKSKSYYFVKGLSEE